MNTEYCIILFAEGRGFLTGLSGPPPVATVWGPAVRADMADKLLWSTELHITLVPGTSNLSGLRSRLPPCRRDIAYTVMSVDGPYFDLIDGVRGGDRLTELPHPSALGSMFATICSQSRTWALFVLYHCDDMVSSFTLDVSTATQLIDRFVYEEPPDLERGFSIVSP